MNPSDGTRDVVDGKYAISVPVPWLEGFEAGYDGEEVNPYPEGSANASLWDKGRRAAKPPVKACPE